MMLNDYEIQKTNGLFIAIIKLLASVLVIYGAFLIVPTFVNEVRTAQTGHAEQLKIRVIANSSSKEDQLIKQQVVENIQAFIQNAEEFSEDIHSYEQLYQDIQKNFPQLNISMAFGDNLFPAKWQFNQFYPQNFYHSVNFVIGSGRGENWFCAVFPTLCQPQGETKNERPPFYLAEWWKNKKDKNHPQKM